MSRDTPGFFGHIAAALMFHSDSTLLGIMLLGRCLASVPTTQGFARVDVDKDQGLPQGVGQP